MGARGAPTDWRPVFGDVVALRKRKITEETCKKYHYTVAEYNGKPVQVANYRDEEGKLVGQKLRFADKTFLVRGKLPRGVLFGMHLFTSGGRRLCITEGEIDALSLSQAQGNSWAVVSLPNGAQSATATLMHCIDYLRKFEEVVLCFDNDDVGRKAARKAAEALAGVVNVCIAELPLKDANEMLQNGKTKELVSAIWNAKPYKPDGLVAAKDLLARILDRKEPEQGLPWWLPELTRLTYGRRAGELILLGAGTGCGKTDFLTQQIEYDIYMLKIRVTAFFLEQDVVETAQRVMGKHVGKRFHVPDSSWTEEEYVSAAKEFAETDRLTLYDAFGLGDWDSIKARMAYQAEVHGDTMFYIDHLTALATGDSDKDERKELERITAEMAEFAKQRGVTIIAVSHLTAPSRGAHENGAQVAIRHFKGSRALGYWSYYMFAIERFQQAEDPELRRLAALRVLKDRFTGCATGALIPMLYDTQTGIYEQRLDLKQRFIDAGSKTRKEEEASDFGFSDLSKHTSF